MSVLTSSPMIDPALDPGLPKKLFDYDVIDLLGEGAGSIIYLVSHPKTKQVLALKHVVRKNEKCERFVEQLDNEFQIGSQISHPGLRKSIELKINRTLLRRTVDAALILEMFDGVSLEQSLPRELSDILAAFIQTGHALAALHKAGYVHCDLKPNNILRDATGHVKVIDLGQAAKNGTVKTRIQGTPDYMAPEQAKCKPVTFATDVFNFGATMYWAFAGKKLPTLFNIKKSENSFISDVAMSTPHDLNPMIPDQLSNLVMECVRTNPAKRPQDMTELTRRLEIMEYAMQRRPQPQVAAQQPAYRGNASIRIA